MRFHGYRIYKNRKKAIEIRIGNSKNGISALQSRYFGKEYGNHLGGSESAKDKLSVSQLEFTFAMSTSPLVQKLIDSPAKNMFVKWNPQTFISAQVLSGMKILDICCSGSPHFARCARKMGAKVYTTDSISSEEMEFKIIPGYFGHFERGLEIKCHIFLDLNRPSSAERIKRYSGGKFDLVTQAALPTQQGYSGERIARELLKTGGAYFNASTEACFIAD